MFFHPATTFTIFFIFLLYAGVKLNLTLENVCQGLLVQRLCPHRQSSNLAPGRFKFRCEQRLQGGFLTLLDEDSSLCTSCCLFQEKAEKSKAGSRCAAGE